MIVTRHAINLLTHQEQAAFNAITIPTKILKHTKIPVKFKHYAVHPVTGEQILSYKKLMNDPATSEVWQTAFGMDFGGMAQGDNTTGQKGTNAMFVMSGEEIAHALAAGKKFTYANPIANFRPLKRLSVSDSNHSRRELAHI